MVDILSPQHAREYVHRPNVTRGDLKKFKVTPNFTWDEVFSNRTLQEIKTAEQRIFDNALGQAKLMEHVRAYLRRELSQEAVIRVTSWWRDPATNAKIGGAKRSMHVQALATDFVVPGYEDVMGNKLVQAHLIGLQATEKFCLEITEGAWTHVDKRAETFCFKPSGVVLTTQDKRALRKKYNLGA